MKEKAVYLLWLRMSVVKTRCESKKKKKKQECKLKKSNTSARERWKTHQSVGVLAARSPALNSDDGGVLGQDAELNADLHTVVETSVNVLLPLAVGARLLVGVEDGVHAAVQVCLARGAGVAGHCAKHDELLYI